MCPWAQPSQQSYPLSGTCAGDPPTTKAISKNPYENENLNRFYGDSAIDFYNGVLKKGEDFVTKVVNFDEETHKNLSRKISSELFGYCIPYESD